MKAAIYHRQSNIRIEEVPVPEVNEDEILVEMKACGLCGSDLMDWYLQDRAPIVLGHEPAGIVAKKGRKVEGFAIGDRVFVHHHVACLTCHYCLHGEYTLCRQFHETNIKPGGFAEYFKVPAANVRIDTLKIPEQLSYEEATFIEPVACCVRALKKCQVQVGDTIAVIGAGTTGLIHAALSKIYGAGKVIVSDFIDFRLEMAERFGADVVVNPGRKDLPDTVKAETEGRGVDIAVVTAPSFEAYEAGIAACRRGGKLCIFAPLNSRKCLKISPKELFFSELQIIPSYSASHLETRAALQLLKSGRIEVKPLITHRFTLTRTAQAFKTALESRETLKIIVVN